MTIAGGYKGYVLTLRRDKTAKVNERVNEITRGRGVEAIVDPIAGPAFPENIEMLDRDFWGDRFWGAARAPAPAQVGNRIRSYN
jgi:hypothetical protein